MSSLILHIQVCTCTVQDISGGEGGGGQMFANIYPRALVKSEFIMLINALKMKIICYQKWIRPHNTATYDCNLN